MACIDLKLYPDEALQLMHLLGGGVQCRIVGGAVRNALMGAPITDIDFATTHTPQQVQEVLNQHNVRNIPTGIGHGTITAVINDYSFEVTTLRSDINTDGRHAEVEFTSSWDQDAQRRDFTVNALYVDEAGTVYDPLDLGLADIEQKQLRFIGDAVTRIEEDVLRILRYYRFYAQYDFTDLSASDRAACTGHADKIPSLSKERVTQEWLKILSAPYAARALDALLADGVMPDLLNSEGVKRAQSVAAKQREFDLVDPIAVLSALTQGGGRYFILSNAQKKQMKSLSFAREVVANSSNNALLLSMYRYGKGITKQAVLFEKDGADRHLSFIDLHDIPIFPVTGKQLMAEGYTQGKALGEELKCREKIWIKSGFKAI